MCMYAGYVHVHTCMYVRVNICMYVYTCVHVCRVCTCVYMYVCKSICMHLYPYVYRVVHVYTCMYVKVYICMYIHMWVCIQVMHMLITTAYMRFVDVSVFVYVCVISTL